MPPKHDLRGGQASADSFVMFNSIFIASINRCVPAAGSCEVGAAIIARTRTRRWHDPYSTGHRRNGSETSVGLWNLDRRCLQGRGAYHTTRTHFKYGKA